MQFFAAMSGPSYIDTLCCVQQAASEGTPCPTRQEARTRYSNPPNVCEGTTHKMQTSTPRTRNKHHHLKQRHILPLHYADLCVVTCANDATSTTTTTSSCAIFVDTFIEVSGGHGGIQLSVHMPLRHMCANCRCANPALGCANRCLCFADHKLTSGRHHHQHRQYHQHPTPTTHPSHIILQECEGLLLLSCRGLHPVRPARCLLLLQLIWRHHRASLEVLLDLFVIFWYCEK